MRAAAESHRLNGDGARNKQLTVTVKSHAFYWEYERTPIDVRVMPGYKSKAGYAERVVMEAERGGGDGLG